MPWRPVPLLWWAPRPPTSETSSPESSDHKRTTQHRMTASTLRSNEAQSKANALRYPSSPPFPTSSRTTETLSTFTSPTTLFSTAILTTTILTLLYTYKRFLRRIPTPTHLPPTHILPSTRRLSHSLFGQVTAVTDADNFRLFHTPLGRLAGWSLWRRVPTTPKTLKDQTLAVRIAGIDAPELSHFGRPAQRYGAEAMEWLRRYVGGRRVRCYVHKVDQYGRVVATVYVRRGILRRDVGLQMIRAGWATVYEAKSGAVFGGVGWEKRYQRAEEWAKGKRRGMWAEKGVKVETPREYKNKYREGAESVDGKGG